MSRGESNRAPDGLAGRLTARRALGSPDWDGQDPSSAAPAHKDTRRRGDVGGAGAAVRAGRRGPDPARRLGGRRPADDHPAGRAGGPPSAWPSLALRQIAPLHVHLHGIPGRRRPLRIGTVGRRVLILLRYSLHQMQVADLGPLAHLITSASSPRHASAGTLPISSTPCRTCRPAAWGLRVLAGQGAQIDTTTAVGRLVFGIFRSRQIYIDHSP